MHDDEANEMARVEPSTPDPSTGSTAKSANGLRRHTLAPWLCENVPDREGGIGVFNVNGATYRVATVHLRIEKGEREANARLIAASPTMLSALKLIVKNRDISERGEHVELGAPCKVCGERFGVLPNDPDDTCQDCVIDTAIAKAEGQ